MKDLPTFLKDSIHTIQVIEEINEKVKTGEISLQGVAVVSLDLEAMYSNMSEDLGTGACRDFLETRQNCGEHFSSTSSILEALDLCLKTNYFTFGDKIFKQNGGVGTGIKLSPTYACIGIGKYETIMFNSDQALLNKILLWKRFIDDVLMLFKGTQTECQNLVDWLNSIMPNTVKFKFEFSGEKVNFLDLEISLQDGLLMTNLFVKPTNHQLFLDFLSNHPKHCKESIPYSQALRVIERCSLAENRDNQLEDLKKKFEERNYPSEVVDMQFERAMKNERMDLIHKKRKKKGTDGKVRLVFTHNSANPPIHQWLRDSKKHLEKNDQAKEIGKRVQICTKQPPNLQRIIGGCKDGAGCGNTAVPDPGCFKCKRCRVLCPKLTETRYFKSTAI